MENSCISLITDFGLKDEYVGVMKGVIALKNPCVKVIDITHYIDPQNILQAAYTLLFSYSYFPKHTVHVIVVDPGVGSDRKIVAVKADDYFFLAPDNGVLSFILNEFLCTTIVVNRSEFFLPGVSNSFHGRDIFAPVSAHIAKYQQIEDLGDEISPKELIKLHNTGPYIDKGQIIGQFVMSDRFGNLISNISFNDLKKFKAADSFDIMNTINIKFKDKKIVGIVNHYEQVKKKSMLAIIGSKGLLEISINCGNAKHDLNVEIGSKIYIS